MKVETYRATIEVEITAASPKGAKDRIAHRLRDAGLQIVWWRQDPSPAAESDQDPFEIPDGTVGPTQGRGVPGSRAWRP